MKKLFLLTLPVLACALPCRAQWRYPATKTVGAEDTYFGRTYKDPFRWLEDLKDKEVEAWFKAQADLTDGLLAKIPGREALVDEWMALYKLEPASYSAINYENGRVFYKKTLGGENVGKLYFREGWNGGEKLLFDPGTYKTGVVTTIESIVPSWDGKHVVLAFRRRAQSIRSCGFWTWIAGHCCRRASIRPMARTAGPKITGRFSTTRERLRTSRARRLN